MLFGVIPTATGPLRWLTQHGNSLSQSADDSLPSWLSREEAQYWRTLKADKRRRDWAHGRRTAKQLLADLVLDRTGRRLTNDEITILPHTDGWPVVTMPVLGDGAPAITLSISHSHERTFCGLMEGHDRALGADVERIEPRSAAFAKEYFTPLEQRFLAAAPQDQIDALTNAIWSGKEAALKAIRRGLAEDTRIVSCLPHPHMGTAAEWLPLRIVWDEERAGRPLPELAGRWRAMDGFVLTLAFGAS